MGELSDEQRAELAGMLDDISVEMLAKYAEPWQGDSGNDILARGMVGAMRPLMMAITSAVKAENPATPIMIELAIRQYHETARFLGALQTLASIKDD